MLKINIEEDIAPTVKYFRPASIEDSEVKFKAARVYKAKDAASIVKYIDIKSKEDINNKKFKLATLTIAEYSNIFGINSVLTIRGVFKIIIVVMTIKILNSIVYVSTIYNLLCKK